MAFTGPYTTAVLTGDDDPGWDDFLTRVPRPPYQQSSVWARVKAAQGWRSALVTLTRDGSVHGGAQLLYRSIPLAGAQPPRPQRPPGRRAGRHGPRGGRGGPAGLPRPAGRHRAPPGLPAAPGLVLRRRLADHGARRDAAHGRGRVRRRPGVGVPVG